jgi:hypothetical protein
MLRLLKNKKGQGVAVEYAITFFLVIAFMASMTVYFKRLLNARLRDSRNYMAQTVYQTVTTHPTYSANAYVGGLWVEYEPYYVDQSSVRGYQTSHIHTDSNPGSTGISQDYYDDITRTETTSEQLPPRNAL